MITRKKKTIAEIQNDRLKRYKGFNFSCETCTKYVNKRFLRHSIRFLSSLGTKSYCTWKTFTYIFLIHLLQAQITINCIPFKYKYMYVSGSNCQLRIQKRFRVIVALYYFFMFYIVTFTILALNSKFNFLFVAFTLLSVVLIL